MLVVQTQAGRIPKVLERTLQRVGRGLLLGLPAVARVPHAHACRGVTFSKAALLERILSTDP